jgi:hypothetical protein
MPSATQAYESWRNQVEGQLERIVLQGSESRDDLKKALLLERLLDVPLSSLAVRDVPTTTSAAPGEDD